MPKGSLRLKIAFRTQLSSLKNFVKNKFFVKLKLVARVKKRIAKFELTKEELGFVTN